MRSKRISKSELIPKCNSKYHRIVLGVYFGSDDFVEAVSKGLPLFTREEIVEIEKKYPDGITWSEIDKEISSKGIFLKKQTFRKHINDRHLPKAVEYKKTEFGREAVFPKEIINNINFIQYYYKITPGNDLSKLLKGIYDLEQVYANPTLMSVLEMECGDINDIRIITEVCAEGEYFGNGWVSNAIEEIFINNPVIYKQLNKRILKIKTTFEKKVQPLVNEFIYYLKSNPVKIDDLPKNYFDIEGGSK